MIGFFKWFYQESVPGLFRFWRDFITLTLRFFAISWHISNFFKPWKLMNAQYQATGFSIKLFVESFQFNVISRLVGMVIRTVIIVWGLLSILFLFVVGATTWVMWTLVPIALFAYTLYAVWQLINPLL